MGAPPKKPAFCPPTEPFDVKLKCRPGVRFPPFLMDWSPLVGDGAGPGRHYVPHGTRPFGETTPFGGLTPHRHYDTRVRVRAPFSFYIGDTEGSLRCNQEGCSCGGGLGEPSGSLQVSSGPLQGTLYTAHRSPPRYHRTGPLPRCPLQGHSGARRGHRGAHRTVPWRPTGPPRSIRGHPNVRRRAGGYAWSRTLVVPWWTWGEPGGGGSPIWYKNPRRPRSRADAPAPPWGVPAVPIPARRAGPPLGHRRAWAGPPLARLPGTDRRRAAG